jgi:small subunit ribosomal protein S7
MRGGKKSTAEKMIYDALDSLQSKHNKTALEIFNEVIEASRPEIEVRSRRVGGATYQVPTPVADNRSLALAIRWIIFAARKRNEKTMEQRLFGEFNDILSGRGATLKKREDTHKMAEANRAFAHFRWFN